MTEAISLGPLLLPVPVLVFGAAILVATLIAGRLGRRAGVDAETVLWLAILVGLVAARGAYVIRHFDAYREDPWRIPDFRDGGWALGAGIGAALAFALWRGLGRPPLRRPLALGLTAGLVVIGAGQLWQAWPREEPPVLAPIALMTVEGRPARLDDFRGRPTVINLWATWCPPCRREMPLLARAQQQYPGVDFVFASQGETAATVRRWLASERLALDNVLIDEGRQTSLAYGQKGYPTTLFFDASGRLVSIRIGEMSAATLGERLARIGPGPALMPARD